MNSHIR